MESESRLPKVELAPLRRLKSKLQTQRELVERNRPVHVGYHYDRHHVLHKRFLEIVSDIIR